MFIVGDYAVLPAWSGVTNVRKTIAENFYRGFFIISTDINLGILKMAVDGLLENGIRVLMHPSEKEDGTSSNFGLLYSPTGYSYEVKASLSKEPQRQITDTFIYVPFDLRYERAGSQHRAHLLSGITSSAFWAAYQYKPCTSMKEVAQRYADVIRANDSTLLSLCSCVVSLLEIKSVLANEMTVDEMSYLDLHDLISEPLAIKIDPALIPEL